MRQKVAAECPAKERPKLRARNYVLLQPPDGGFLLNQFFGNSKENHNVWACLVQIISPCRLQNDEERGCLVQQDEVDWKVK
jgi:hypothetical protein